MLGQQVLNPFYLTKKNVLLVWLKKITQHFPQRAWVEHNPTEIWNARLKTTRRVIATASIESNRRIGYLQST